MVSALDGIILNDNIWLDQDDRDAPDTLYIMIQKGKERLCIILSTDPDVLARKENTDKQKVYDTNNIQHIDPSIKDVQIAVASYIDRISDDKKKSDLVQALEYFPVLMKHVNVSKVALAKNLGMEAVQSHMSSHLEKLDTYIAEGKHLQSIRSTHYIAYNAAYSTYKKLKSQLKAASTVLNSSSVESTSYWDELSKSYKENLAHLISLDRDKKTFQDTINKLYQEIEQIRKDQSFVANFDTIISEVKSEKAQRKQHIKKKDIELNYKGEFASRIQSIEERIDVQKQELLSSADMRTAILEQQEDYINQFVILHKPAEQIFENIQSYTKTLESQSVEHKKSQRETNKYARQIEVFDYTNKILNLMNYEKKCMNTQSSHTKTQDQIERIIEEFDTIPSEQTKLLSVAERIIHYRRILDRLKENVGVSISKNMRSKVLFLIDKDFVSISQRKPRLYLAHKQKYQSEEKIAILQKELSSVDKGFSGKDKDSDAHKDARKWYVEQIDIHEKLIKQSKKEMKLMVHKIHTDHKTADTRTKQLSKNISTYQQLILKSRIQVQDMLASGNNTDKPTQNIDLSELTEQIATEEQFIQNIERDKSDASNVWYHHILQMHDLVFDDAKNYIEKIVSSIENFESKPTFGVAKELRITGGDKVFLQRSYELLDAFIERFEGLKKLLEDALLAPSDLERNAIVYELKQDVKDILKYITPYRKS